MISGYMDITYKNYLDLVKILNGGDWTPAIGLASWTFLSQQNKTDRIENLMTLINQRNGWHEGSETPPKTVGEVW